MGYEHSNEFHEMGDFLELYGRFVTGKNKMCGLRELYEIHTMGDFLELYLGKWLDPKFKITSTFYGQDYF